MLTYYIVANYHTMSHHTLYSVQCSYLKIDFGLLHWLLTRLGPRYNLPNRAHPLCQPLGAIWWTHLSTTPGYWFSRPPYCEPKMTWRWGAHTSSTATPWRKSKNIQKLYVEPRQKWNPNTCDMKLSHTLSLWKMQFLAESWACKGGEIIPIEYWRKKTYAIISTLFRVILLLRNIPSSVIETMWPENSGRIFQWRGPDLGKIKW